MDSPGVRSGNPVSTKKDGEFAQAGRVAPGRRNSFGDHRPESSHLAQPLRSAVENRFEHVAEVCGDAARQGRPNPFYFARQVSFERDRSGRPQSFEIFHPELFAVARMAFQAAPHSYSRSDLHALEFAHDRDTLRS